MTEPEINTSSEPSQIHAKPTWRFKRSVKIAFFAVVIAILLIIIEFWYQNRTITQVHIKVKNHQPELTFLDSAEIFRLLTDNGKENIKGATFRKISIKTLESRVKANLFVNKCEIARNLLGDLFVEISPSIPIARFMRENKPSFYIDSTGKIMPVTEKFTARVLLVTREDTKQLPDFENKDKELLNFIKHINKNKFLKSQISQIDILENRNMILYPQIGEHIFELGTTDNWETKIKKFITFYEEIIPRKGWSHFKRIKLQYDKQIIGE
jgi:cell division protein FtsQ